MLRRTLLAVAILALTISFTYAKESTKSTKVTKVSSKATKGTKHEKHVKTQNTTKHVKPRKEWVDPATADTDHIKIVHAEKFSNTKAKLTNEAVDERLAEVLQQEHMAESTVYAVRQESKVDDVVIFGPPPKQSFITREGSDLKLDGNNWYCSGISAPWLSTMEVMPERWADEFFSLHKSEGASCIRVFAFANGKNASHGTQFPLQNNINEPSDFFNELSFRHMDRMLLEAAKAGIRLIMTLGNGYTYQGGADWFAKQALGPDVGYASFYVEPEVKAAYKDWLKKIISRVNYYTGITYANDPTIFAWEVINEPHLPDDFEAKKRKGTKPGTIITEWFSEMTDYIRSLDANHLIATGEEGYRADQTVNWGTNTMEPSGQKISSDHWWIDTGLKGVDYKALAELPNIDISTLHIIPEVWNVKPANIVAWLDKFISSRANITRNAGKAIYIGEFGMTTKFMELDEFTKLFRDMCSKYEMNGCLMWPQLAIGSMNAVEANKALYSGPAGPELEGLYQDFILKSGAGSTTPNLALGATEDTGCTCTDTRPPGSYGPCDQQVMYPWGPREGGRCSLPEMVGFCHKSCLTCDCTTPVY